MPDIATLTKRLASGDEEAFRDFHSRYFDRLFRYLLGVTRGDEGEAQDALQETFIRVARYVRHFDDEQAFWCWLCAVANSAARDRGRKNRRYNDALRRYALQFFRPRLDGHSSEAETEIREALSRCLANMPSEDRFLLEEKYFSRASTTELASTTGLTEKAVESRLLRLRRYLRSRLLKELQKNGL